MKKVPRGKDGSRVFRCFEAWKRSKQLRHSRLPHSVEICIGPFRAVSMTWDLFTLHTRAQNEGLGRRQSVFVQDRAAARAEKSLNAATVSACTRPAIVSRASPGLYQRTSPPLRRQWCLRTSPQPSANLAPVHKIENTCLTRSCNNSDYPTNGAAGVQYGRKSRRRL